MKGRLRRTKLSRFLWIFGRPLHPVRVVFAVAGSLALSLPCFLLFLKFHYIELTAFIIYPLLFVTAHLIWFRLPFVKTKLRWLLFWITIAIVIALSAGFLFSICEQHGVVRQVPYAEPEIEKVGKGMFLWMESIYKSGSLYLTLYFFVPALLISLIYTTVLLFALKVYRNGRTVWYRKLNKKKKQ